MPFQPGNQLYKKRDWEKERVCRQRLVAALNESDSEHPTKLHRMMNALLQRAFEGDVAAINSVMDRVDGKVPQPIAGDPDNPLVIERVIHEIVKPEPKPLANASYSQAS